MNSDTRFIEYCYSREPRMTNREEELFFEKMYHLHRATRDPTFEKPIADNAQEGTTFFRELETLYLFPYGSELLLRIPVGWEELIPLPIYKDIVQFFEGLLEKGINTAIFQCIDGRHIKCELSGCTNKTD